MRLQRPRARAHRPGRRRPRSTRRSRSGAARPASTPDGTVAGDKVLSYGNSELRGGITALSPKEGASLGDDGNGWSHTVYTATPGIPGDSGSAFLNRTGQALGVLSTVALAPLAGSNGVGDLGRELAYLARAHELAATLANGTEPFRGPLLPADRDPRRYAIFLLPSGRHALLGGYRCTLKVAARRPHPPTARRR